MTNLITEAHTWLHTDQAAYMLAVDEQVRSAQYFSTTPGKDPDPKLTTAINRNYPELAVDSTSLHTIGRSLANYYAQLLHTSEQLQADDREWVALNNLAGNYASAMSSGTNFTAAIRLTSPLNRKPHTLVIPEDISTDSLFHDITPGAVKPRIAAISIIPNPTQGNSLIIEWQDTVHGLQQLRSAANPSLSDHAHDIGPWMPAGRYLITWQGHDPRTRISTAITTNPAGADHNPPALLSALSDALDTGLLRLAPHEHGAILLPPAT